ncbi:helix-turn-helix domain-containing protein [Spirillospora sp. NPDC047418]
MDAPIGEQTLAPPFDIADRIAAKAGGPVIIEDASFHVLGHSAFARPLDRGRAEAILGRRIPGVWLEHLVRTGSLDRLRGTADVVDLPDGPWEARRRLITAFRAGGRLLGFVWVAEGERPLGAGAAAAFRRAVDEETPALLRHLERLDAAEAHRARLTATLLDGLPGAPAAADRLGFDRDGRFMVLSAAGGTASGGAESGGTRLLEHLRLCLDSFQHRWAVTAHGDGGLALVALRADESAKAAARLGHEVLRLAGDGPLRAMRVAASSVGAGLAVLPRLRAEATAAITVSGRDGAFVAYADVDAEVLVADVVATLPAGARLSGLDRLRAADGGGDPDGRPGGGELERTLRAYLAACGSASAAARELGVHVTTVRHRLTRITAVSGLRLDRPDVRIACDLLLRRL